MARAIDADYLMERLNKKKAGPANKRYTEGFNDCLMRVRSMVHSMPTLTPPNEWVNRVRELDELYTKLQIITGFTVEQLLEMFAAGYTLEKPDYSKSFEEMASLAETTPPNEALTQADLDSMDYDKVWIDYGDNGEWALVVSGRIYSLAVLEGAGFEDILRDEVDGETMDRPSGDYAVYRRPLEGEV